MIDIPLNKALVVMEDNSFEICVDCVFEEDMIHMHRIKHICLCRDIACNAVDRKDGKNVIFKLVDLPEKAQ